MDSSSCILQSECGDKIKEKSEHIFFPGLLFRSLPFKRVDPTGVGESMCIPDKGGQGGGQSCFGFGDELVLVLAFGGPCFPKSF